MFFSTCAYVLVVFLCHILSAWALRSFTCRTPLLFPGIFPRFATFNESDEKWKHDKKIFFISYHFSFFFSSSVLLFVVDCVWQQFFFCFFPANFSSFHVHLLLSLCRRHFVMILIRFIVYNYALVSLAVRNTNFDFIAATITMTNGPTHNQ